MYQIMRMKKLKTAGNMSGSLMHMKRENGKAKNADISRTHLNVDSVSSSKEGMKIYNEIESNVDIVASNNVHGIEFMVTATPEFFMNEQKKTWMSYFNDGLKWIEDLVGKKNIVASSIQLDETTPHLSVLAVPVVEGVVKGGHRKTRLSCATYMDGSVKLSGHQTAFHEIVAEKYHLQRGTKGSLARHIELQQWYGEMREEFEGRIRDLEDQNDSMREDNFNETSALEYALGFARSENDRLKVENKRSRKLIAEMSKDAFSEMIEKTMSIQFLINIREAIEIDDKLPRAAKSGVIKLIEDRRKEINAPKQKPPRPGYKHR